MTGQRQKEKKNMRIIEQNVVAKSLSEETEDGIAVADSFVAVVDGSTSKTPRRIIPGMTNGRCCMSLVCEFVRKACCDMSCKEFCEALTDYVRNRYSAADLERLGAHPEDRLTASCAVYSSRRREVWLIGDCQCIVDGCFYGNPKPDEEKIAERRAAIAISLIESGRVSEDDLLKDDIARKAILPQLVESMSGQNLAYAVVDGFPIPADKVRIIPVPDGRECVVLATDGYPFLRPTLAESELMLQRQLDTDPLNIRSFKATKGLVCGNSSFDDRSYIRFIP